MASQKTKALETYKKMLVIFSAVAVVLPSLLNMTDILIPLAACVCALPPLLLWKYPLVQKITRAYEVVVLAVPLCASLFSAVKGLQQPEYPFHAEYLSVLCFSQIVLPSAAVASVKNEKADVLMMRIIGCLYAVEVAVVCFFYLYYVMGWVQLLLFAASALVVAVLPFLINPIDLSRFSKKTVKALSTLRKQYESDEITKKEYEQQRKELLKKQ